VGLNEFIGRIGKVLSHEINKTVEIIAETRKGYNQKGVLYNSSGEDSPPVKDDKIVILKVDGSGKGLVIGVFNETQGAKPGEKIYFARNENGEIKSKLSMLGKGEVLWELQDFFELLTEKTIAIKAKKSINIESDKQTTITAEKININKDGENAARKNDTVKIKIPANTFIVSVSGQAVGTPNATELEFEGEITSGSDTVFIGN